MKTKQAMTGKAGMEKLGSERGLRKERVRKRAEHLEKMPLFSTLSEKQIYSIAEIASESWREAGAYICRQGDIGENMFIVYSGEVEVIKDSAEGRVVYVAQKDEILGEMAIFAEIPRTASLRARGDVKLIELRGEHFLDLLRKNPEVSIEVIKVLVRRLAVE